MADGPSQLPERGSLIDENIHGGGTGGSSYIALATGGRFSASNDTTALFHEAVVESTASYLIGFQPSAGDPGERPLKVRTRREGVKVHAPDRYFVGQVPLADQLAPPAIQALAQVADASDIPLRVATLFLDSAPSDMPTTTLAVELSQPPGPSEWAEREVTLLIEARPLVKGDAVRDTADVTLPPSNRPGVATRELHLHPGVWQARVVVRDPATEKLGSVLHTFEVPEAKGLARFVADSQQPAGAVAGAPRRAAPRPPLQAQRRALLPVPGVRRQLPNRRRSGRA